MQHFDLLLGGRNALEAEERTEPHKSRTKSSPLIIEVFCYFALFFFFFVLKWERKFDPNSQAVSRQLNFARTCNEALRCYVPPCWNNLMDCSHTTRQRNFWKAGGRVSCHWQNTKYWSPGNTFASKGWWSRSWKWWQSFPHHLKSCFHFCCLKLLLSPFTRFRI